ncbi:MAG: cyclic di-GMP phosphodiesterase [Actinomycetota bacterium]|nr:cyclic di-GMP phosphodiesterase [Actinomycetota bacterium]
MMHTDSHIVVIDDEPVNVRLLQKLLETAGYTNLSLTSDPRSVIALCSEKEPDLVITDLRMPILDGFGLLEQLRTSFPERAYLPILVITADGDRQARERSLGLGASDFLTKPFDRTEVLLRVHNLLETRALHSRLRDYNLDLEEKVRDRTERLWKAVTELEASERRVRLSQQETVTRLSIAAEFRDDETARHIRRMSQYCALLAKCAGIADKEIELLQTASEMHDVGKIGIPDNILLKPGRLDPEERAIIEQHPDIGNRILGDSRSELLEVAATIALSHHERIDGKGYPEGLGGEEIPFVARIASIADVFDALTTDRVYRKAFDLTKALEIMKEGRGMQFDADLLDLFFDAMPDVLQIKQHNEDEGGSLLHQRAI